MKPRRALRTSFVGGVAGLGLLCSVGVSGCAGPGADEGRRVAAWVGEQEHVLRASAWVSDDPWNKAITIDLQLEPDIADADLLAVTEAAERRAREAGWQNPLIAGALGDHEGYSNLGGPVTVHIFLDLRGDPAFAALSARGDGECGGAFCVEMESDDPAVLLGSVQRMLAVAREAGGVQSNLDFTASSADGHLSVTAQPHAPIDESVALLESIGGRMEVLSAQAWPVEPVGDLPPLQILEVTVPDPTAVTLAETLAAEHPSVELRARPAP